MRVTNSLILSGLAGLSMAASIHSGQIKVPNGEVAYRVQGSGPVLFLVHGFPLSGELFAKSRETLSHRYKVVTPDLRGFGDGSTTDTHGSVETYAHDMFAVMDHLGVKKAIIGGMSMGGPVALEMYKEQPERFKGLILIDSTTSPAAIVEQGEWPAFGKQAQEKGVGSKVPILLPNMFDAKNRQSMPALVKGFTAIVKKGSVNGAVFGGETLANRPDQRGLKIQVPVLLLAGMDDPIYPMEMQMQMKMHQDIKGSHLSVIPGAAHAAIMEKPGPSAEAILDWAERIH